MLEKIAISLSVAWQNIRANPLHTGLSTLGIVIGVAALVSILSLADGLEHFAREQIASTTSLHSLSVQSRTQRRVDNIWVPVDRVELLNPTDADSLRRALPLAQTVNLRAEMNGLLRNPDTGREAGARLIALEASDPLLDQARLLAGRKLQQLSPSARSSAILISRPLALQLFGEGEPQAVVGKQLTIDGRALTIAGVAADEGAGAVRAALPLEAMSPEQRASNPPALYLEAQNVEEVPRMEEQVRSWLEQHKEAGAGAFQFYSNRMRLEQTRRAMLLFKLIMGLITGISVVVGGIGVMNVLLVSISERTSEIGIRKATGAKRKDIVLQFLSESVAISGLGSLAGLILGMLIAVAAVPVVRWMVDVPFYVAFTPSTFVIIGILTLAIGILFGTYPALRAARLTPIDAIRRE